MPDIRDLIQQTLKPFEYEDPDKLDVALATMPLAQLYDEAETLESDYSEEDRLVIVLLKWFKQWFSWVNAAECDNCGHKQTSNSGAAQPTAEECAFGTTVTELWRCDECGHTTRFPRYNDPLKLLQTRRGRCGEWCNVMTLLLRALGRDVRYIWNTEDHVWNEVWSDTAKRWIHVDSCEAAFDKPLTYTDGWGKSMAYVIGFSTGGAADVTRRYVRRPEMQLPRDMGPELEIETTIKTINGRIRDTLDPVVQVEWFERDEQEAVELASYAAHPPTSTEPEALPARQSGSAEWVASRGEDGPAL